MLKEVGQKLNFFDQYLSVRSQMHEVISSNIANTDTPGYKSRIPSFEYAMGKEIGKEMGKELKLSVDKSQAPGLINGNNVSRMQEMAALAENNLFFRSTVKILNKQLSIYKYAVNES